MPDDKAESRRHFRISYPLQLRPELHWGEVAVAVIDVSESGIRLSRAPQWAWAPGESAAGVVRFCCGEMVQISGAVVRVTVNDVALCFARGLSFSIMLCEQRALRLRRPYFSKINTANN